MIAILDYQSGNLKSLSNALSRQGFESEVSNDPATLLQAALVLLPGVGSFEDAVSALNRLGLKSILKQRHLEGKPLLGICLGMQLFYNNSTESRDAALSYGLGLLEGEIRYLSPNNLQCKVPHMGWNQLISNPSAKVASISATLADYDQTNVYFVHSYGLTSFLTEEVLFYTDHGSRIPAIILKPKTQLTGALMGFQFHPEKSGLKGETLLAEAIRLLL